MSTFVHDVQPFIMSAETDFKPLKAFKSRVTMLV